MPRGCGHHGVMGGYALPSPNCSITPAAELPGDRGGELGFRRRALYRTRNLGPRTDESGAVTRSYVYGDFGQLSPQDAAASPVSFAGYTFDVESGLYYVRSRYLEPATGRFTTRDPAGVWEDGRNRGNAYAYAGNNPVTFVDPTGRSTYRWHNCGGPWPGPRTIKVEYEGCSKSRRDAMSSPVCRAFRASGQSADRVLSLWLNDFTGVPQSGAETTRSQMKFWFGGPDNATSSYSKSEIYATLDDVFDATTSDDFDIDCEGGSGDCATRLRQLGRLGRQRLQFPL